MFVEFILEIQRLLYKLEFHQGRNSFRLHHLLKADSIG